MNFNGIDFTQIITINDIKRPILPSQRLTTKSIVGRHGAFFFQKQSDALEIEVKITIRGSNPSDLRNKIRDLADKLDTDQPAPLIFNDEPDKYVMAIISDDTNLDEIYRIGQGTLTFFVPDPFYYAITDDTFTYTTTGAKTFTRKGTASSYPKIEIKGTNSVGSITIDDGNGNVMTFNGSLTSSETLVLDSKRLTAYIIESNGDIRPVLHQLDELNFPVLKKGSNTVTVSKSGSFNLTQIKIYCNSCWK